MSGKRILDAARLLSAARAVARSHADIRSQQWDTFTKTSQLAKAVKNQTDRFTVTAGAAYELAKRLSETAPGRQPESRYGTSAGDVRSARPADAHAQQTGDPIKDVLTSDSHNAGLEAIQVKPEQHAVPDGTIPPYQNDGSNNIAPNKETDWEVVFSRLDSKDHGLAPSSSINIPSQKADEQSSESNQATLDGIDTNVFHTSHSAGLMGGSSFEERRREYAKRMSEAGWPPRKATASPPPLVSDMSEPSSQPVSPDPPGAATYEMHQSRVPATRLGRLWQYSGLATSMAFGALGEGMRRATGSSDNNSDSGSLVLSEANMNRLVAKLSRMRGAALKLGQMMSFQDSKMLAPAISAVLARVQDSADYMPVWQRDKVLLSNLGSQWRDLFGEFHDTPIAAASIGQVHRATLASTGQTVAVKVQYPGVRDSIDSDLNNLSLLLTASRLLPRGLFLDKTIANARTELGWECDYVREAECAKRFATLLADEKFLTVPEIIDAASGPQVLTAEMMTGRAVTKIPDLTQAERDWIGTNILRLCLRELMEWRFMQTDPNWTNFLYRRAQDAEDGARLELLDFGASREFPDAFVAPYVALLIAASKNDLAACRELSIQLGYLTGSEGKDMLDAHVTSITTLAEPFAEKDGNEIYDFANQTITDRVRANIGLMVKHRLSPPPEETYSLHRKLSGAFLLCARLGSRVKTREMFVQAVKKWEAARA